MIKENRDIQAKNKDSGNGARDRLLNAAEQLFCDQGFNGTSIRELTEAAGCNVAAVNYHFSSKENLYKEMFRRHLGKVFSEHQSNIQSVLDGGATNLDDFLRSLVQTALKNISSTDKKIPLMKLIIRESLNPQLQEEVISLDLIKNFLEQIRVCLQKLVPELSEKKAMMYVFSIEGLLMHPMLFYDLYGKLFFEIPIFISSKNC